MKDTKTSLKEFGTAVLLFIIAFAAIITSSAAWSSQINTFELIFSILNIIVELGAIGYIIKKKFFSN